MRNLGANGERKGKGEPSKESLGGPCRPSAESKSKTTEANGSPDEVQRGGKRNGRRGLIEEDGKA
jgi:hypothetical protein